MLGAQPPHLHHQPIAGETEQPSSLGEIAVSLDDGVGDESAFEGVDVVLEGEVVVGGFFLRIGW